MIEKIGQFFGSLFANEVLYIFFLIIVLILLLMLTDGIFKSKTMKKLQELQPAVVKLIEVCIKVLLIIVFVLKILSSSRSLSRFMSEIVLSSSLIVVVLGFVFQEGLSNLVHGFILVTGKPFRVGDRISITVNGTQMTGYVESIDLRSTTLRNVINSAYEIIPNSVMDTIVIDNTTREGDDMRSSNFVDLRLTYDSNLEKAISLIRETVQNDPYVREAAQERGEEIPQVTVMVRDLSNGAIDLRTTVVTQTVEDNFAACSDIRRIIAEKFAQEPDIRFACTYVRLVEEPGEALPRLYQNVERDEKE